MPQKTNRDKIQLLSTAPDFDVNKEIYDSKDVEFPNKII